MVPANNWEENPYIIGSVIYNPKLLIDRQDIFDFIKDNLIHNAKVILLHGQRRIGKSSVLTQIPNFIDLDNFVFVPLSLEGKSQKKLSEVLHELAQDIIDYLNLPPQQVILLAKSDAEENAQLFAKNFLQQICEILQGKNLVLLIDEFDVLGDYNQDTAITQFFPYLQSIVYRYQQLFIIPVVGRRLDDLPNLLGLFREAPNREIGLLDRRSAEELIIKPAEGVLEYEPDAINAILELSAGHPYFTQVICFALFSHAREEQRWRITRKDVELIVDEAIEFGEGGLAWFRDGLPIVERVIFSVVAEAQHDNSNLPIKNIQAWELLQQYGVILTEEFYTAQERLITANYLEITEIGNLPLRQYTYKVTIELVRRWLVKRYSLRREIWQLEQIDSEANKIYEVANRLRKRGDILNAVKHYEQALDVNPNHFSALFELAEEYLDSGDFSKAVELYTRAYQVDPIRTEEKFSQALLGYGQQLLEQDKLVLAKEHFAQALSLQPNNTIIQAALDDVKREERLTDFSQLIISQSIGGQALQAGNKLINLNQGISLNNVAAVEISDIVTDSIDQLQDSKEPDTSQLANFLKELQAAIEADTDLVPEDKAEVLAQVIALAEAGKNPEQWMLRKMAKMALRIVRGTLAGLPSSAKLVEISNELLPAIAKHLDLKM